MQSSRHLLGKTRARRAPPRLSRFYQAPRICTPRRPLPGLGAGQRRSSYYVRHLPTAGRVHNYLASAALRLNNQGRPRVAAPRPKPPGKVSKGVSPRNPGVKASRCGTASRVAKVAASRLSRPFLSRASRGRSCRYYDRMTNRPIVLPAYMTYSVSDLRLCAYCTRTICRRRAAAAHLPAAEPPLPPPRAAMKARQTPKSITHNGFQSASRRMWNL